MEHRLYPREQRELDVTLARAGQPSVACRSRDVSPEGMFIALDAKAPTLEPGDAVQLAIAGVPGRICAQVVHRSVHGVGLLFAVPVPLPAVAESMQPLRCA